MKNILLGFIAIGLLTFVGCDKDDDTDTSNDTTDTSSDDGTTDDSSIKYGEGATDMDGNTYQSVIIGEQEWMVENLKTTKYSDGTSIRHVPSNKEWENLEWQSNNAAWCNYDNHGYYDMEPQDLCAEACQNYIDCGGCENFDEFSSSPWNACDSACWLYDDCGCDDLYSWTYDSAYGKLYNWYAVETEKLCPTGWHVPSDAEWTALTDYVAASGYEGSEGTALRSISGWLTYMEVKGTDNFGWKGLPGGYRSSDGNFSNSYNIGYTSEGYGFWWSSSDNEVNNYGASTRFIYYWQGDVKKGSNWNKAAGLSVRCLKD